MTTTTTPYKVCIVDGCHKQAEVRSYCAQHMSDIRKGKKFETSIADSLQPLILSACCAAKCTKGDRHEYGQQYCSACKEPCTWKPPM